MVGEGESGMAANICQGVPPSRSQSNEPPALPTKSEFRPNNWASKFIQPGFITIQQQGQFLSDYTSTDRAGTALRHLMRILCTLQKGSPTNSLKFSISMWYD